MDDPLMTVKDACAYLRIGRTLFYDLVNGSDLPVVRIGSGLRVRPEELRRWIDERESATAAEFQR